MEKNNLFHDRYFLERLLGRGNFSEVWLAKDVKTDIHVALKIYAPATGLDDHGMNVLSREFAIVVNANQRNLLKPLYYDSFERKPYLVLPYCKNGSILKQVGQFTEEEAWHLLHDVAAGLAFLHSMNPTLIHQDIKPDNIMIGDNGAYMITDFGVSAHAKSTLRKSMSSAFASAGTTAYMAPERFSKDNTPIKANDVWSLGAMTYEMLTGDVPFTSPTLEGGILQKNGAEIPNLPDCYSPQLNQMIQMCLEEEPWERPTAEQVEQYAQAVLDGENPFTNLAPWYEKYKTILIASGCAALLSLLIICGIIMFGKSSSQTELTGIAQATYLIKSSNNANEGFKLLNDMASENNAEATYLLSRLYFGRINNEYDPDSIRTMRQILQDKQVVTCDFEKAHNLLLKTIEIDDKNYYALYELGRDCLAGNDRNHDKELETEDFQKANELFSAALQYAQEKNDADYVGRIKEEMEKIKTVL